ncbi:primosomal protein N' [Williamsia sp.]|uniref:primosomal protein N' n=1 Tax=Williamsia sp. TaxID=1872085 RepID=UPI001A2AB47A|nr:primosomal protein N' [Williamsia sp.]MBJ7288597.1 primosomal protein N' [Williamsia sp.]
MSARAATRTPAAHRPVASVLPMLGLAHLDRPFDYQVDTDQDEAAVPGARVRVRFSGRLVDGFVLERLETSEHPGKLGWLDRVVSPEPVLTPEVAALCRAVADRYAGTMTDVLRLAIPPRHGRTEQAPVADITDTDTVPVAPDPAGWARYRNAESFTTVVGAGGPGRAAWQALPGEDWSLRLAELATHAVRSGHGVLIVVPDQRDLDRVERACREAIGDTVVALSAGLGPAARYRRWLRVLRGTAMVVVGTRSTAFAPVHRLGLMVVWDDGDDSLTEPRAPYPHPREVAVLRAAESGCALVIGGLTRTAETQTLVDSGWMHDLVADRATVRAHAPRILAISDEDRRVTRDPNARVARIPEIAFDAARAALAAQTPVLISVPRRGYHPSLACERCRTRVRCRRCRGPMYADGPTARGEPVRITCRWCGHHESSFRCAECGDTHLRALTSGSRRTAEELGKAFAGVPVITSGGDHMVDTVPTGARVVVSTPGAEPVAEGGYGAAVLLDTWAQMDRPDLRAGEQTLRRWFAAITLVRSASDNGTAVIVADAGIPVVQAAIRFDAVGFAVDEVRQRAELGLPPAVTMASVDGAATSIAAFADSVALPSTGEVLGPVDLPPDARPPAGSDRTTDGGDVARILLRVNRSEGRELVRALRDAQIARTTHHDAGALRVQVDPPTIG